MTIRIAFAALAATALFGTSAAEEWVLSSNESRINFVSVKAGEIPESNHFTNLSGAVSEDGAANIQIALDSVETNIDIRNERMRKFLFETDKHPTAAISASIDLDALENLQIGDRDEVAFVGELDLHGAREPIDATLIVTRIAEDRVLVETNDPIILYTDLFGLAKGVQKLMELASLPSITPAAPVTVSLVFERKE